MANKHKQFRKPQILDPLSSRATCAKSPPAKASHISLLDLDPMLVLQMPHHVVVSRDTAPAAREIAVVRRVGLVGGLMSLEVTELREATGVAAFGEGAFVGKALVWEGMLFHVFAGVGSCQMKSSCRH